MLQCLALKKLHGDEVTAFIFINIVDRADTGTIHSRGGTGFALEPLDLRFAKSLSSCL